MTDSEPRPAVSLTINGVAVDVAPGTTILEAARQAGIDIPTICYHEHLTANAICRVCTVEVQGARTLQPACVVPAAPDMIVDTESPRVRSGRKVILELLASTVDLHD